MKRLFRILISLIVMAIVCGFYPMKHLRSSQKRFSAMTIRETKLSSVLRKHISRSQSESKESTINRDSTNQRGERKIKETASTITENSNYWINELYGKNLTERAHIWNTHKHLSSVGDSGLTTKHINSVYQLALSHNYVKVKLSSHKLNSLELANQYLAEDSEESRKLASLVDKFEIRHRGILFRRKDLLPEKVFKRSSSESRPIRESGRSAKKSGPKRYKPIKK